MQILISGGSGFLGRALTARLQEDGVRVAWLSRDASREAPDGVRVLAYDALAPHDRFDAVVNLAGADIAGKRWSDRRKKLLFESRLGPTRRLVDWMRRSEERPRVLLSGSAVGWYGAQGDTPLGEDSAPADDFSHSLCEAWENAAMEAVSLEVPVLLLRTGIALHPDGGMLGRLLLPFRMGLGGRLGDGRQMLSWVARRDWVEAVRRLLLQHLEGAGSAPVGPVNLTAPEPVSNREFTRALAGALHRPAVFAVPGRALRLALGQMSTLLLDGQRVLPERLQESGFEFRHPRLAPYLESALRR
ncbi:TIGR01777 family oxidoreductase [Luteimonas dalianensis]|uniref:TIGR01777 family oxidoreductase n=1 Tax=Luteimonas dalianensis TaxID=1148196 RepID=UPI003BEFE20B